MGAKRRVWAVRGSRSSVPSLTYRKGLTARILKSFYGRDEQYGLCSQRTKWGFEQVRSFVVVELKAVIFVEYVLAWNQAISDIQHATRWSAMRVSWLLGLSPAGGKSCPREAVVGWSFPGTILSWHSQNVAKAPSPTLQPCVSPIARKIELCD